MKYVVAVMNREFKSYYLQFFMTEIEAKIQFEKEIKELKEKNMEGEVAIMVIKKIKKVENER